MYIAAIRSIRMISLGTKGTCRDRTYIGKRREKIVVKKKIKQSETNKIHNKPRLTGLHLARPRFPVLKFRSHFVHFSPYLSHTLLLTCRLFRLLPIHNIANSTHPGQLMEVEPREGREEVWIRENNRKKNRKQRNKKKKRKEIERVTHKSNMACRVGSVKSLRTWSSQVQTSSSFQPSTVV